MPRPVIKDEKKIDCKSVADICPVHVFDCRVDEKTKKNTLVVARPGDCIGCRACESASEGIEVVDE